MGLERQRLDDLLELVSMATAAASQPEGSSPIVDWNKLLALAAGQLGNVYIKYLFFFFFSLILFFHVDKNSLHSIQKLSGKMPGTSPAEQAVIRFLSLLFMHHLKKREELQSAVQSI